MSDTHPDHIQPGRNVGFVGLGLMGKPMALNMVKAGVDLSVWNRSAPALEVLQGAGARAVPSVDELSACDVIFVMLPDLAQIESVLEPLWAQWDNELASNGVLDEKRLVVGSSVSPDGIRTLCARLNERFSGRVHLLDAPVSGGTTGAEAGTLAIMVGGSEEDFAALKPLLETMGSTVLRMGELGAGSVAKACNQLLVGVTTAALGEATVIAETNGLNLPALYAVLSAGLAGSNVLTMMAPRLAERDYTVRGPAKFMVKDLASAADAARAADLDLTLVPAAATMYERLVDQGLGDDDLSVIRRSIELAQTAKSHSCEGEAP